MKALQKEEDLHMKTLQTLKTEVIDELRTKGCTIQDKDGVKITIDPPPDK